MFIVCVSFTFGTDAVGLLPVYMYSVAVRVQAETRQTSSVTGVIVSTFRSYVSRKDRSDDPQRERKINLVNTMLGKLNVPIEQLVLKTGSKWCFVVCTHEEQLQQLYGHLSIWSHAEGAGGGLCIVG